MVSRLGAFLLLRLSSALYRPPRLASLLSIFFAMILIALSGGNTRISGAGRGVPVLQQPNDTGANAQAEKPKVPANAELPDEDAEEGELEPAAVALDVSRTSPLIQALYQATRLTKENEILEELETAQKLLNAGADVKAVDAQGRTALHWGVFGSSYSTKVKTLVKYEEIADALIAKGVEVNREDVYQDTALDYLLYAPTFEMQTLLIENGASSGFLAAFYHFLNDRAQAQAQENSAQSRANQGQQRAQGPALPSTFDQAVELSRRADLTAGQTLSVRLDVPVYSDRSRTGDPIMATVTYPLCRGGENIACPEGQLLIPPGTRVDGTVLFATKAPDKYSQPRLVLDFSNVLHKDGTKSPLYARVLDVDNARETIRNNEILGIIQPHASKKRSLALGAISAANPIAGYTIKGMQTVYGLSIRREIMFPAGTDIQIQIVQPSMLKQKETWAGWPLLTVDDELRNLVTSAPMRTATPGGVPSDPTNFMFIGSQRQVIAAFGEAGWFQADDLSAKSALKVASATVRQTGYGNAPMSTLMVQGRPPELMFQKSLDTFAKRHHLRVWKLTKTYQGQDVWVAAATHDIATMSSRGGTKWTHRIDPHVDREREWVETDLLFIGTGVAYALVDRPAAPKKLNNSTGDEIVTDGKMAVVKLAGAKDAAVEAEDEPGSQGKPPGRRHVGRP
jgi:LssY C-terminus